MACFCQFYSHLMLHLFWAQLRRFSGSPFVAISKELSDNPYVSIYILRTLQSPVCLFVPVWLINLQRFMISQLGQFAENYGETFVTIYRDFIDHCDAVPNVLSLWFYLKITWDCPWTIITVYASRRIIFSLSIRPEIRINCSLMIIYGGFPFGKDSDQNQWSEITRIMIRQKNRWINWAKFQNTRPVLCISLNNKSA